MVQILFDTKLPQFKSTDAVRIECMNQLWTHCDRYTHMKIHKNNGQKGVYIELHFRLFLTLFQYCSLTSTTTILHWLLNAIFEQWRKNCIYSHQKSTSWPSEMLNSHHMNVTSVYTGFVFILVSTLLVCDSLRDRPAELRKNTSLMNNLKFQREKKTKPQNHWNWMEPVRLS